ncbi:cyclin-like protein, partial [Mycena floridula]
MTATKASLYEASTQFKNWRYSPESLQTVRNSLNHAAVSVIRATFEADEPGSSANVSFLKAEEELLLVKLYVTKITQLCGHFNFGEEVEATAISYLKRFYLKNTVMDWHPKNVMLTALFLATKTTNNPISLESYTTRIPRTSASDVLDLEFLVAQSLGFEFAVWHAHRALWGIWLDLQSLPDTPMAETSVYDEAMKHVRAARLTDAELVYSPPQIALAAVSLVAPDLATRWLASKIPSEDSRRTLESMTADISAIIKHFGNPPDVEAVREVDRRLRICKNPEKVVGSRAYLAKKAEEEKILAEKRSRKPGQIDDDDDDPFGDTLAEKRRNVDNDDDDD